MLSFPQFLELPVSEIAPLAPASMIFAAGGTRRAAVLAGIAPTEHQYARWAFQQMLTCFGLFFEHGVRHIITHAIIPSQYQEVTKGYREKLLQWVDQVLAGSAALAGYQQRGWRVHLLGGKALPDLAPAAQRLKQQSLPDTAPNVWVTVTPDEAAPWDALFAAVHASGARTQAEAIRAQFGASIPPVQLYIGSGKPGIFPAVVPPLLLGKMQCYWSQKPGFMVDQKAVRTVLYDYACTRKTWQQDKTGRAKQVLTNPQIWENAPMIGVGVRIGPFWYPAMAVDPEASASQ